MMADFEAAPAQTFPSSSINEVGVNQRQLRSSSSSQLSMSGRYRSSVLALARGAGGLCERSSIARYL